VNTYCRIEREQVEQLRICVVFRHSIDAGVRLILVVMSTSDAKISVTSVSALYNPTGIEYC